MILVPTFCRPNNRIKNSGMTTIKYSAEDTSQQQELVQAEFLWISIVEVRL
jgi:hypothetical protein